MFTFPLLAVLLAGLVAPLRTPAPVIEPMPAALETRYALSALPAALRADATVYLLDPAEGYRLSKQGTSGLTCVVQRTAWELTDFRDDIYIPLCYDAEGTRTYLRVIMDAAALRAQGSTPEALFATITARIEDGTYPTPARSGVSYMMAPVQRTVGPPELKVVTIPLPHLMFYAPHLKNADIGAAPDLADPSTLLSPFIDRQGHDAHSYMIQLLGAAEKAKLLADEAPLLGELCAYRDVLCLPEPPR
jgi:hypothetical protein